MPPHNAQPSVQFNFFPGREKKEKQNILKLLTVTRARIGHKLVTLKKKQKVEEEEEEEEGEEEDTDQLVVDVDH